VRRLVFVIILAIGIALALLAPLLVCSRSFTLVTEPDTPLTSNFRLLSTSGSAPPSATSVVAVP
jgi:hypothetical protein